MAATPKITSFLWFDGEAEEAAKYYIGIFKNSKIKRIAHYGEAGKEIHGRPPGSVMVVEFELNGQPFAALNGGPVFKFNEAVSFVVNCKDQKEVDYYWEKLGAGGDPAARQCGWLKDKYGLSWQVAPEGMDAALNDPDPVRAERSMQAMLGMKKIDIAELRAAADGVAADAR